jgi:hypothetical protein
MSPPFLAAANLNCVTLHPASPAGIAPNSFRTGRPFPGSRVAQAAHPQPGLDDLR